MPLDFVTPNPKWSTLLRWHLLLGLVLVHMACTDAVFSPMTRRRAATVAISEPGLETQQGESRYFVHHDHDPIFLFGAEKLPLRACLTSIVDQCVPQYRGTSACKSITPSCRCYRWTYAGVRVQNSSGAYLETSHSVVNVSDFQTSVDCVDFVPTGEGTITFVWRLSTHFPVLPPMYYGLLYNGYSHWVGRYDKSISAYAQIFTNDYCKEDPLDVLADCEVEHSIAVVPARENWRELGTRRGPRYENQTGIIVGGTLYALVLLAVLGLCMVWHVPKYKSQ